MGADNIGTDNENWQPGKCFHADVSHYLRDGSTHYNDLAQEKKKAIQFSISCPLFNFFPNFWNGFSVFMGF